MSSGRSAPVSPKMSKGAAVPAGVPGQVDAVGESSNDLYVRSLPARTVLSVKFVGLPREVVPNGLRDERDAIASALVVKSDFVKTSPMKLVFAPTSGTNWAPLFIFDSTGLLLYEKTNRGDLSSTVIALLPSTSNVQRRLTRTQDIRKSPTPISTCANCWLALPPLGATYCGGTYSFSRSVGTGVKIRFKESDQRLYPAKYSFSNRSTTTFALTVGLSGSATSLISAISLPSGEPLIVLK